MFAKEFEEFSIEVTATMIKSEFRFLEVQQKVSGGDAVELDDAPLGEAPEGLDAIDVRFSVGEFVLTMIDSQVLGIADIDESMVATPAVRVNHTLQTHLAANHLLQRLFPGIRDNFREDPTVAFEDSEDDCFATCSATTFTTHPLGAEVRLIDFDLSQVRGLPLTLLKDSLANLQVDVVDSSHGQADESRGIGGRQIHGEAPDELPEFGLTDF